MGGLDLSSPDFQFFSSTVHFIKVIKPVVEHNDERTLYAQQSPEDERVKIILYSDRNNIT